MPDLIPYIIHHIAIENYFGINSYPLIKGSKYYCVFWWYNIPLGDLYIDRYNGFEPELRNNILLAIEPSINFYQSKKPIGNSYKNLFKNAVATDFSIQMNALLVDYLHKNLPDKVEISVIICTRNRSEQLDLCLKSLLAQTSIPQEIIVVDNNPADDSTKNVVEKYHGVIYYKEPRKGLDIARNTGAKKASLPIVAYVDDDVHLHPLWTYMVWQSLNEDDADAMTGLVLASSLDTESQQIFEEHWKFNKGYTDKKFDNLFVTANKVPKVWDIGAGANMAFKKSVLEKVNFFDERLDVGAAGCSGDSEIWFRILSAGHVIKYNPRAVVHHVHRRELKDLHKQLFSYMRGHAASVLIQHEQNSKAEYQKYLYYDICKYYLLLIRVGFPSYKFRYQTLWSEVKGILSGIRYYYKNKSVPPISK
ncbi:MAG: glycosyltransferase [Pyrinomonadaceae bacterium]|nr:glycosyltransferase [Sphingobacteriaceae bacterium]